MTRSAVILARGLGTRMQRPDDAARLAPETRRAAEAGQKGLIPLGGRPFLDYVADSFLRAGLRRICFIVAPEADVMRSHAERIACLSGATVECAVQAEPRGTADAALAAEGFAGGEPFVLSGVDNLFPASAVARVADCGQDGCCLGAFDRDELARSGNIPADRVSRFAVVRASAVGDLLGIVEKPPDPDRFAQEGRVLVSMGLYRFTPAVFDYCRRVEPHPARGELELTSAVDKMARDREVPFRVVRCEGPVFDLTQRADIPALERALAGRRLSF